MEPIPDHDKYLDPPDDPLHSECDGCGNEYLTEDLCKHGRLWLCEDCLILADKERAEDGE
jgi:hypothetical protein